MYALYASLWSKHLSFTHSLTHSLAFSYTCYPASFLSVLLAWSIILCMQPMIRGDYFATTSSLEAMHWSQTPTPTPAQSKTETNPVEWLPWGMRILHMYTRYIYSVFRAFCSPVTLAGSCAAGVRLLCMCVWERERKTASSYVKLRYLSHWRPHSVSIYNFSFVHQIGCSVYHS